MTVFIDRRWEREPLHAPLHLSRRLLWLWQAIDLLTMLPILLVVGSSAEGNLIAGWLWDTFGLAGLIALKLTVVLTVLGLLRYTLDIAEARSLLLLGAFAGLVGTTFNVFALWQMAPA